eukprot:GHVS01001550.1.p1 GENE.GHVS01001550.1~~GHVS01001550.1.p1  ORF type:complete len:187 (+),score=45.92 GHVS01001550.1:208-768(+)
MAGNDGREEVRCKQQGICCKQGMSRKPAIKEEKKEEEQINEVVVGMVRNESFTTSCLSPPTTNKSTLPLLTLPSFHASSTSSISCPTDKLQTYPPLPLQQPPCAPFICSSFSARMFRPSDLQSNCHLQTLLGAESFTEIFIGRHSYQTFADDRFELDIWTWAEHVCRNQEEEEQLGERGRRKTEGR